MIQIDSELMNVTALSGNTLTVSRGYNGTIATPHGDNSVILPSPGPSDFKLYFTQTSGASQYQAVLYNLDWLSQNPNVAPLGTVSFTMPADVEQVALEGGPGNNLIQVDPSVTRNMFLYGGPGNNTLIGGSGSDTLVGGPGSSVIYGGTGDSILYGGDMPSQDAPPQLDSSGTVTPHQETPGHNTLIAGTGNDELYAGSGGDVLIGGSAVLNKNGQYVLVKGAAGRDVLVGGSGDDLLMAGSGGMADIMVAGSGNDILIGDNDGSSVMGGGTGNNLYLGGNFGNIITAGTGNDTLVGGAGIDYLAAGSGNDNLYADSNPYYWAQAQAAALSRNVFLVAPPAIQQEDAITLFDQVQAEMTATGQQISILGHLKAARPLTPTEASSFQELLNTDQQLATERIALDTILGANFLVDTLIGGAGVDQLYGNQNAATWLIGDLGGNFRECDLLQLQRPRFRPRRSGHQHLDVPRRRRSQLATCGHWRPRCRQRDVYRERRHRQWQQHHQWPFRHVTPVCGTDGNGIRNTDGTTIASIATNSIMISQAAVADGSGVALTFGLTVGNGTGHISGIQTLVVQTLAGNDTVTVNFGPWAGLGVYVQCGSGNNVVNASTLQAQATLLGGTGNDVIKIGTQLATGSTYNGGTGQSELDIQGSSVNGDQVSVSGGKLLVDGVAMNYQTGNTTSGSATITGLLSTSQLTLGETVAGAGIPGGSTIASIPSASSITISNNATATASTTLTFGINFTTLVVIGGPGNNVFTTDGTIPNVFLEGGSGTNTLSAAGGTARSSAPPGPTRSPSRERATTLSPAAPGPMLPMR